MIQLLVQYENAIYEWKIICAVASGDSESEEAMIYLLPTIEFERRKYETTLRSVYIFLRLILWHTIIYPYSYSHSFLIQIYYIEIEML